jgi:hypothetical protein
MWGKDREDKQLVKQFSDAERLGIDRAAANKMLLWLAKHLEREAKKAKGKDLDFSIGAMYRTKDPENDQKKLTYNDGTYPVPHDAFSKLKAEEIRSLDGFQPLCDACRQLGENGVALYITNGKVRINFSQPFNQPGSAGDPRNPPPGSKAPEPPALRS